MGEWRKRKLGELVEIKHGFAFKGEYFSDEAGGGPVLLTPGNFAVGGGFRRAKGKYYTGEVPDGYVLRQGDLIVTMTDLSKAADTLGNIAQVPGGATYLHNQRIGLVRVLESQAVDENFLHYALRTSEYRHHVVSGATGSTVKHTSPSRICEYTIELPPLGEQRAIAEVFGALDDKIAVNERLTATVAQLASAHFAAAEKGRPVPLADLAVVTMGQSPPGETYNEQGIGLPFYQGTRDFTFRFPEHRVWCTSVTRRALENDVLVSVRAPVGRINVASEECGIGRGLAAVRSEAYPHVLLQALGADASIWSPYESEGTVFGSINKKQFAQLLISWPTSESIDDLEARLEILDERIQRAAAESRTLAALRDNLLPQLMSGKLRVRDAERIVEDAV